MFFRRRRKVLLIISGGSINALPDTPTANAAPVISASNLTISEDEQGDITISYSDADSDAANWTTLTATVLSGNIAAAVNTPANGQIRITTTQANWFGSGSIEVTVEDSEGNVSNTLTIGVTVSSVNDAPTLNAGSLTINEDASGVITLTATDADGTINWSSLRLVSAPAHGTVQLNTPANGQVTYAGAANNHTDVTFTLAVSDNGGTESAPATMTVTINSVADAPVISGTLSAFNEDTIATMTLGYSSADSAAANWATLEQVGTNANLTLTLNYLVNGNIRVTPVANYNGSTSFQVRVQDVNGVWSNTLTVGVTVTAVADSPVLASPIAFNFNEGVNGTLDIDSSYSHPDSTARRTTAGSIVCSTPTNGTLSINQSTGVITYTANDPDWNGSDSFTVQVYDANSVISNTATVNVTVAAVNDAPAVFNLVVDVFENNAITIPLSALNLALDVDNAISWGTVQIGTAPGHGSTSVNGTTGDITYTPAANNRTAVTFTWRVQDASGEWSPYATIEVNIGESPIIQAMKAAAFSAIYRANELSGSSFAEVLGGGAGTLSGAGITYNIGTPAAGQVGDFIDGSPVIGITNATTTVEVASTTVRGYASGDFTIVIWARDIDGDWTNTVNAVNRQLFQIRKGTGTELLSIQVIPSGAPQWLATINNVASQHVGSVETATGWVMFAMTFQNSADILRYFRDGIEISTDTNAQTQVPDTTNMSFRVFGNTATSANGIRLANFGIKNDDLTAAQLLTIQNAWAERYRYATLKQTGVKHGVQLGVAVPNGYAAKSATYKGVVEGDFSIMATENAAKYSTIYNTSLASPNWTPLTEIVTAAMAAYMGHALHPLFWHSDTSYISTVANTKTAAQAEIIRRLDELRARYDSQGWDEPFVIDVCNEILVTSQAESDAGRPLRQDHAWAWKFANSGSVGTQASAREWIDFCFIETAERFPDSLLVIADYRNEKQGHWKGDDFYDLVADMVADGVPIDGVHFQGHWEHYTAAEWLFDSTVVSQINRFKALTNYRGKALYVGWSELDIRLSPYSPGTAIAALTAQASSTGSTLDMGQNIFDSGMVGFNKVLNLTDGTSRTITGYTDANTVTLDGAAINDTWDGDVIALSIEVTGTASASSSGTTLIATTAIFDADMVGYSVMNTTDGDVAVITAFTSTTQVTVSKTIGDNWDNDALYIGQASQWYNIIKSTAALVDYIGFWNAVRGESWHGTHNNTTLRKDDLSKMDDWFYVARALFEAS